MVNTCDLIHELFTGGHCYGCATNKKVVICGSFSREIEMLSMAEQLRQRFWDVTVPNKKDGMMDSRFHYINKIAAADLVICFAKGGRVLSKPMVMIYAEWLRTLTDDGYTSPIDILNAFAASFGEATSYEFAIAASMHKPIVVIPAVDKDIYDNSEFAPPDDWFKNGFTGVQVYNTCLGG